MSMYMDVYGYTGHRSQSSIEYFMLYEQGPLIVNNDRTLCTGVTEVFPLEPSFGNDHANPQSCSLYIEFWGHALANESTGVGWLGIRNACGKSMGE